MVYLVDADAVMQPRHVTGSGTVACRRGSHDCHIEMWIDGELGQALVQALYPILYDMDPTFKYIVIKQQIAAEFDDMNVSSDRQELEVERIIISKTVVLSRRTNVDRIQLREMPATVTGKDKPSDCRNVRLDTPAIAIGVFLPERHSTTLTADEALCHLQQAPWLFHHRNELVNARRPSPTSVARQDYYEFSPTVPLLTIGAVHVGNRHLRFTIFTSNMPAMRDFYTRLTCRDVLHQTDSFCLFQLSSWPGFDLQLGLKYSPQLIPNPLPFVFLHFRVCSFRSIDLLLSKGTRPLAESVWTTYDPDGNRLILQETGPCVETVRGAGVRSSGCRHEDVMAMASQEVTQHAADSDADQLAEMASCDSGCFSSLS